MSERSEIMTIQPVRKTITVNAPQARAFEVFTGGMGQWWNPDYTIGRKPFSSVVIEPKEGGRWFERDDEGGECDWGRVLVWDPPRRAVLAWQISAEWAFDPNLTTELEIRFLPEGPSTTRVELEHRLFEEFGERAAEMRTTFDGPSGWVGLLDRYSGACE